MKNINTIIFDLDGTLLNSLEDLHACFNHAIEHFGYPSRNIDEIKSFVGNGIKKAIERALPQRVPNEELNEITNYFRTYYKEHMVEFTKPYEGIIELLSNLKKKGYKLGIVSNKFDDEVKKLSKSYFGDLINIAIGESYEIRRKPEIDGVVKAVEIMGSKLENCVFVGDSNVDIETAKNAGIPCISVLWGYRDKNFLMECGGKLFAETTKDIEKILYLR